MGLEKLFSLGKRLDSGLMNMSNVKETKFARNTLLARLFSYLGL